MTIPLQEQIVYGPIASRRLGRSLGINVLPHGHKVCNFNCPYCQYGWTAALLLEHDGAAPPRRHSALGWAPVRSIVAALDAALARDAALDRITLAGNGEPTLHPEFPAVVEGIRTVRDRRAPHARIAILSNASTASEPAIAGALARIDECYMKLDAGSDVMLRRMNASPVALRTIVEGIRTLREVTLQSLFTRDAAGRIDNTTAETVDEWLRVVGYIRPKAVHVYTIDRDPAWKRLERVPRVELEAIAARVRGAGVAAMVY